MDEIYSSIQGKTLLVTGGGGSIGSELCRQIAASHPKKPRMERQKQYLVNFMGQAVKAMKADMGLPVSLYQSLTDDMVTNLSLDRSVYLATEAMDMHFTADGIVSLKAKSKKGSVYDALYDLIIQTFYTEEQSEGESK